MVGEGLVAVVDSTAVDPVPPLPCSAQIFLPGNTNLEISGSVTVDSGVSTQFIDLDFGGGGTGGRGCWEGGCMLVLLGGVLGGLLFIQGRASLPCPTLVTAPQPYGCTHHPQPNLVQLYEMMSNISMSARMHEGSLDKRFQTQHALGGDIILRHSGDADNNYNEGDKEQAQRRIKKSTLASPSGAEELVCPSS